VPVRVDALIAAGRIEDAETLVTALDTGIRGRNAPAAQAAVLHSRAILAEGHADYPRAARLFISAAQAWQALPRPYVALLARERRAGCLINAGESGAGVSVLQHCVQGLTALGASFDGDRIAHTLRAHGVAVPRVWRGGRHGYGDDLSPREIDVIRLVATGQTNREIAATLCRSTATVATQLRSVMRKLGVTSRVAAAARAIDAGMIYQSVRGREDERHKAQS
jgi:DNA-binding CsgD family transcriptional regulator